MVGEVAGTRITATPMTSRAISAAGIGNLLEWYDWSVYVVLARQIGAVFFPSDNPLKETLSAFLFYGVGFLMRPIGAIVIGHLGDKYGRKNALVFTVIAMAIGTFMIGCLPGYAQMGAVGPVLLVAARLLQGFSAGGEWGGSTSFIAEYAPEGRRGLMASFQQVTTVSGLLVGTFFGYVLTAILSNEQMLAWGWRVPFLAGILLAFVGVYLRSKVDETPKYTEIEAKHAVAETPFMMMLSEHLKETVTAFCFTLLWTVGFYIVLTYMPTFMVQQLKLPQDQSLLAASLGQLLLAILIPFGGALSDRIGRRPLLIFACAVFVIGIIPAFKIVVASPSFTTVLLNQLFWAIPLACYSGAGPAAIAEIFPTKVRYVALSTGYGTAVAIFGGFANWFANTLIAATGDPISPSYYVIAAAIASLITMIAIQETYNRPLK